MGEEERALWKKSRDMWRRNANLFAVTALVEGVCLLVLALSMH